MPSNAAFHSNHIRLTSHAQLRSQQRGLRERLINTVHEHADVELHVGGSCRRLSISYRELKRLVAEGVLEPRDAERCKNVALIVDGGALITAYRH
jgi:hypothetical protein